MAAAGGMGSPVGQDEWGYKKSSGSCQADCSCGYRRSGQAKKADQGYWIGID